METNATRIEENARRIERELQTAGRCTIADLETFTRLSTTEILLALGWLACEHQIDCNGSEIHPLHSDFYF